MSPPNVIEPAPLPRPLRNDESDSEDEEAENVVVASKNGERDDRRRSTGGGRDGDKGDDGEQADEKDKARSGGSAKGGGVNESPSSSTTHPAEEEEKKDDGPPATPTDASSSSSRSARPQRPTAAASSARGASTATSAVRPPAPVVVPCVCLRSGLNRKATPYKLRSWVALSLTLDGRDKITKVIQYVSRFLGWYHERLAASVILTLRRFLADRQLLTPGYAGGGSAAVATAIGRLDDDTIDALRRRALRCRSVQSSLTECRKAFRLGRSFVEVDKLSSVGLGPWLWYWFRMVLSAGGTQAIEQEGTKEKGAPPSSPILERRRREFRRQASSNVGYVPSITPEHDRYHEDDDGETPSAKEEGQQQQQKVIARPGRPRLPRRVSSNIGWGPATVPATTEADGQRRRVTPPSRSLSGLGRRMYRPLLSRLSSFALDEEGKVEPPPPDPAWKLLGGTLKLLGLLGFWACDNASFLLGTGAFDDHSLQTTDDRRKKDRVQRKKVAQRWAAKSYFVAAVSGFVVNAAELVRHRNGTLRNALVRLAEVEEAETAARDSSGETSPALDDARRKAEGAKARQFVLFLAFVKSCCDVLVFSNNPGIDLHMRYRGKKMNEGFHSICGFVSASTVIYNNFPNK